MSAPSAPPVAETPVDLESTVARDGSPAPVHARSSRAGRVWAASWRLALATLIGLIAFGTVWPSTDVSGWSDAQFGGRVVGDLLAGLTALSLVPFRHRAPRVVTLVVVVLAAFSTFGVGAAGLAVVSLATRRQVGEIVACGAVFVTTATLTDVLVFRSTEGGTSPWWVVALGLALVYALLALVGVVIGSRRALVASLRERAELVERDQRLREEHARDGERAHLAREMHDVLGHRLSLVALHAGALEYRGRDLDGDETVRAAGVVRAEAHAALADLRDVLGVLRDPTSAGASEVTVTAPPQPTLLDLDALLDETRRAGASVECTVDDETTTRMAQVPPSVGRHAYRVLQEAFTNARRHAPGQPVRASVTVGATDVVRIRIENPLGVDRGPVVDGHGLTGLSERVRLVGGRFDAGVRGDDFVVEADLPWSR